MDASHQRRSLSATGGDRSPMSKLEVAIGVDVGIGLGVALATAVAEAVGRPVSPGRPAIAAFP